jgi:hypothetical protein
MAQSPTDMGQDSKVSPAQGRFATATLVMNPSAGEGKRKTGEPPRASQLSETISVPQPAVENGHESEEPSIEEYMAALLERTRQFTASPVPSAPSFVRPMMEPSRPAPTPAAPAAPGAPVAPASVPAGPVPVPECRDAISELRELANISARSSFNTHRAQHLVVEMRGKRFVAIIAMLTSVGLLNLSSSVQSPAYITAVAAVTTACAYSLKYLSLGRELASLCADSNLPDRAEG